MPGPEPQVLDGIIAVNGDLVFACHGDFDIKVFSTIMTNASPVFSKMLHGAFLEGQSRGTAQNPQRVRLVGDAPKALILLCQLLHLQASKTVGLYELPINELAEAMLDLSVAADKYDCIEALELQSESLLDGCARAAATSNPSFDCMADFATAAYYLQQPLFFTLFTRRLIMRYNNRFSELAERTGKITLPMTTLLRAAELRHDLCQTLFEDIVSQGTLTCWFPGCEQSASSSLFIADFSAKLTNATQSGNHGTDYCLQTILQDLLAREVPLDELRFSCLHWQGSYNLNLHDVAINTSADIPGLCLTCARQGGGPIHCEHETFQSRVLNLDHLE